MNTLRRIPRLALSVRQPWAWAIVHGGKDVENRNGHSTALKVKTKVPFRVAIHASKGMTKDEYEMARDFMATLGVDCPRPDDLVRGAIVGSVRIRAVIQNSASPWFFGRHALALQHAAPCKPIPASGQLGYFEWKEDQDALQDPKPWMLAWPDPIRRKVDAVSPPEPAVGDLFK